MTINIQASLASDMNTLANSVSKDLKDQCEKTIPAICETRVTTSIESLLAEDSLAPVKETCAKIAIRMATERINQWIQSHIVGGSLFIKDMELEINRFLRNNSPVHNKQEKRHDSDAPSPTVVMDELRVSRDIRDSSLKNKEKRGGGGGEKIKIKYARNIDVF